LHGKFAVNLVWQDGFIEVKKTEYDNEERAQQKGIGMKIVGSLYECQVTPYCNDVEGNKIQGYTLKQ
jgi:hypothetical protein